MRTGCEKIPQLLRLIVCVYRRCDRLRITCDALGRDLVRPYNYRRGRVQRPDGRAGPRLRRWRTTRSDCGTVVGKRRLGAPTEATHDQVEQSKLPFVSAPANVASSAGIEKHKAHRIWA